VRWLLVRGLLAACGWLQHPVHCQLAAWSDQLDQRWKTGVWEDVL